MNTGQSVNNLLVPQSWLGAWGDWSMPQCQQSQATAYLCLSKPRLQGRSGPLGVVIDLKLLLYHLHPGLGILHAPLKVLLGLLRHCTCEGWEGPHKVRGQGLQREPRLWAQHTNTPTTTTTMLSSIPVAHLARLSILSVQIEKWAGREQV